MTRFALSSSMIAGWRPCRLLSKITRASLARSRLKRCGVPPAAVLGRRAGILLGKSRKKDVIDAALVLLASEGDLLLTSDSKDLEPLAASAGLDIDIVPL